MLALRHPSWPHLSRAPSAIHDELRAVHRGNHDLFNRVHNESGVLDVNTVAACWSGTGVVCLASYSSRKSAPIAEPCSCMRCHWLAPRLNSRVFSWVALDQHHSDDPRAKTRDVAARHQRAKRVPDENARVADNRRSQQRVQVGIVLSNGFVLSPAAPAESGLCFSRLHLIFVVAHLRSSSFGAAGLLFLRIPRPALELDRRAFQLVREVLDPEVGALAVDAVVQLRRGADRA